jgi:hypothetical protein
MKAMRQKFWFLAPALLLALLGGHFLLWRAAAQRLEKNFAGWQAMRQHAGWTATTGQPTRGGWPLAATLTLPDIFLKSADMLIPEGIPNGIPEGLTWSAERVVLRIALLQPGLLTISAEGTQRLRRGDGPDIPFRADRLRLTFPLERGFPRWAEIAVDDLRAGLPAMGGAGDAAAGLTIGTLQARAEFKPAAPQGEAAIAFTLHTEAIGLPPNIPSALGPRIAEIGLEGALNGPLPRGGDIAPAAAQWRDGGGTLEIGDLHASWGPFNLTTSATLALDEQLQPMGTGSAKMTGHAAALDALADGGVLRPRAAMAAKAVLGLLARPSDAGGEPEVEVPLTLQGRMLAVRQIPLVRLPRLAWPSP